MASVRWPIIVRGPAASYLEHVTRADAGLATPQLLCKVAGVVQHNVGQGRRRQVAANTGVYGPHFAAWRLQARLGIERLKAGQALHKLAHPWLEAAGSAVAGRQQGLA